MFLRLEENVLENEFNPFQFSSTNNNEEINSIMDCLQLFIVEDPTPTHAINSQADILISSGGLDDVLVNTTSPDEFGDVLLPFSVVPNPLNEVISHNNISTNNVDDDSMEDTSASEIDSQNSSASANEYQFATQPTDENNIQPDRLAFSHDVQPEQKHHYLSNKFHIDDGADENCGISYIQGIKTEEEMKKKLQVLPHLLIPRLYHHMKELNLLIYAVVEEQENGMRIWYKNRHKGFLSHHQIKADAEFSNPIILSLNNTQWDENGYYKLAIYMLTKLDKKIKDKEEIYRLDEKAAIEIHKAEHIVSSKRKHLKPTRLLVVLKIGNKTCWHTCGLSNFIQPPVKHVQSAALHNSAIVQIALPSANINFNTLDLSAIFQPSIGNLRPIGFMSPIPKRKKI